jgi:flavin reductase (DIM6/NTAB) family NADH-FMN oxidoreductase RutF
MTAPAKARHRQTACTMLRGPENHEREEFMNNDTKKAVLRMIPYGLYVLTADDGKGNIAAATVNWVTQTAFVPPRWSL